uniref:Uncharacterized protein n=1 Tax=Cannabis sativa TaxID=3483 RepID=A0A803Q0M0_CANSA
MITIESHNEEQESTLLLEVGLILQLITEKEREEAPSMMTRNSTRANLESFVGDLPKSVWAKDAEKDDFQSSAQSHWAKLKGKHQINVVAKLHYKEPMMKEGKRVVQLDLAEVAEKAQN